MKKCAIALIEYIVEQSESLMFSLQHRTKPEYFSRSPKLTFHLLTLLILNLLRKSIAVESMNFFYKLAGNPKAPKRQTASKARDKISYLAFKDYFDKSCELAITGEDAREYKGYRVFGVDGTLFFVGSLEDPGLREYFGESTTVKGKAMCRIGGVVDVLNHCIVNAAVSGLEIGERELALTQMEALKAVPNAIFLFDRGYWSPQLVLSIIANKHKFVMRLQSNHAKSIANNKQLKGLGLRLFSFTLPSGTIETLLTNLSEQEVSDEELIELYAKRWGIESKYLVLKDRLEIENFSEKSLNSVLQDIYATLVISNLSSFICFQADEIIEEKTAAKNNKYKQKSKHSTCISLLADRFIDICICPNPLRRIFQLKRLVEDISGDPTYIGKSKSRPRDERKMKTARSRNPKKSVL